MILVKKLILAAIGNAEWRITGASILEVVYPLETWLSLVEVKRRANTVFWLPFLASVIYLVIMYLCYCPEELHRIFFLLFRNCAL